jgi:hypothetical protein
MKSRTCVFGLALMAAWSTVAIADRNIDSVDPPDAGTPMSQWTPAQQYSPMSAGRGPSRWGYGGKFGLLLFADEMGDKLSEAGRFNLIQECIGYKKGGTEHTLLWAMCGPDVKAFDIKKFEAELKADQISEYSLGMTMKTVNDIYGNAKKLGETIEAAAKDDPGVAAVLKLTDEAKAEWQKYLGAHKAEYERYLTLKDAVRSGKSNHKNFSGCWEATQPAFAKLVTATKFPWEASRDYLPEYVNVMLTSTENYITVASFASCTYSVDAGGEALAAAALSNKAPRIRVGWRTIALAKALDPKFKPKFADRSIDYSENGMQSQWLSQGFIMSGINDTLKIMTPKQGEIRKVKKDGDVTTISFKGGKVSQCLNWKETRKITSTAANGDPIYERICTKRGMVEDQTEDVEINTKFATGAAAGTSIWIVGKFPVTVWKGKKFVAVLGQPKK